MNEENKERIYSIRYLCEKVLHELSYANVNNSIPKNDLPLFIELISDLQDAYRYIGMCIRIIASSQDLDVCMDNEIDEIVTDFIQKAKEKLHV